MLKLHIYFKTREVDIRDHVLLLSWSRERVRASRDAPCNITPALSKLIIFLSTI